MSDMDDLDNVLGDVAQEGKDKAGDADQAGEDLGEAYQSGEGAAEDAQDGDQSTADKGKNVSDGAGDALGHGADALKALGITDPGLRDAASDLDGFTDDLFGPGAPEVLPPVTYELFFGERSPAEALGEGLLSDGLDVADGLVDSAAGAMGVSDYLGTDAVSSIAANHDPFEEDLEALVSQWEVGRFACTEGLSEVFRCELVATAIEVRDPAVEAMYQQSQQSSGLLGQLAAPYESAMALARGAEKVVDDAKDAYESVRDVDQRSEGYEKADAEYQAAKREREAREDQLAALEAQLAEAQASGASEEELADLRAQIDRKEQECARARRRERQKDDAREAARGDIGGAAESLLEDAVDAVGDLLTEGEDSKAEGPVYINVPLDPANFLGQTCSFRIVRRDDFTRSERWITGKVVEMEDLGVYRGPAVNHDPTDPQKGFRAIRLSIEPELGTLRLHKNCRVFNDRSALEIVREVFRTAGVYGFLPDLPGVGAALDFASDLVEEIPLVGGAVSDALSGQYIRVMPPAGVTEDEWTKKRELCVQYNETDLDFVSRLLEEEGIFYGFEQSRGYERIVFMHDPKAFTVVPTVDGRPAAFLWPQWSGAAKTEVIRTIAERRTMRTGTISLRDVCHDHAPRGAGLELHPTDLDAAPVDAPEDSGFTDYRYPASLQWQYAEAEDDAPVPYREYDPGKEDRDFATLRFEEARTRARSMTLYSNVIGVAPGRTLKVRGYYFQDKDPSQFTPDAATLEDSTVARTPADHLVVRRVTSVGSGRGFTPVEPSRPLPPATAPYDNVVEAYWVDAGDAPYLRPPRVTPKPRIDGVQTATVVDSTGSDSDDEDIYRDHPLRCRVKVRFHWDARGELPLGVDLPLVDQGRTGWVRMAQPWGGNGHGALLVPRVGTEVAISFLDGDPDRPVVLGCLYDGEHPLPLEREGAEGSYESVIKTRSAPLGWDERESFLRFVDDPSEEHGKIGIQAGRYFVKEVRTRHTTTVEEGDETLTIKRHDGELIEKAQTLVVSGEKRTKTVKAREEVHVHGDRSSSIKGGDEAVVTAGKHWQWVEGRSSVNVGGARTLEIEGGRDARIGREDAEPILDLHEVEKTKTDTIEEVLAIRADSLAVGQREGDKGGGLTLGTEDDGHTIRAQAKNLRFEAGGEVRVESEEERVRLEGTEELEITQGGGPPRLSMNAKGIRVEADTKVTLTTEAGSIELEPDVIRITAEGERRTLLIARDNVVRFDAATVLVKMTNEIELSSSGPGRIEP